MAEATLELTAETSKSISRAMTPGMQTSEFKAATVLSALMAFFSFGGEVWAPLAQIDEELATKLIVAVGSVYILTRGWIKGMAAR